MKNFRNIYICLFVSIVAFSAVAQPNHAPAYGKRARDERYRRNHDCTQAFPARSFNRDYAGLASTNLYHLEKTLKEYVRLRCLTSEQVRRLTLLFPTDREKYDFLIYAFNHVFDIENFSMTGTTIANRNARDAFYRFLVREGVPAGDYYCDPYGNVRLYATPQLPYYAGPDPRFYSDRGTNPYDGYNNNTQGYDNNYGYGNDYNAPNGINSGYRGMLSYAEFETYLERIRRNTFDKGRLDEARQITRENRLTANQVMDIMRLFNNDGNRLDYAKFAYDYVYDRQNYRQVVDGLAFDSNKKDLMRFLENR